MPVVSAAAAAALLASVGTAGLTGAFGADRDSASLADVGQQHETSAAPVADSSSQNPDWEAVTKAVAPSVVAIQVQTSQGGAEGSGVIIDDKGHVVTNNHVVSGAENDTVQVTLSDGRLFDAKIVGLDPATDLAVVQLVDAPDDLQPATLGDSDDVTVGESVLAVGNPLGLANTATTGIVSAVDRPVSASGEGAARPSSPTRSRSTPRSTPGTRAVRCSTRRAASSASRRRSRRSRAAAGSPARSVSGSPSR